MVSVPEHPRRARCSPPSVGLVGLATAGLSARAAGVVAPLAAMLMLVAVAPVAAADGTTAVVGPIAVGSFPRPATATAQASPAVDGTGATDASTAARPIRRSGPGPLAGVSEALANGPVTAPARGPAGELIGLYYFRARYYDPSTGRFLQRDPVWNPGNLGNQYTFVGNNPVNYTDPTGEIAFLPFLGLAGLGLLGGMEATGWGASAYTGDPGLEVAPSQMAYHAITGSSIFGGSRGFESISYSGGERVYQGAIAAASFLGGGIAGATARGASIPAWALGADAALNIGLGAYETSQGRTIMGPLQTGLGLVGLAGLRGGRGAIPPDDPLLDNNILVALHNGDPQAVLFAQRNRGLLSTISEVRDEFLVGRSMTDWQRLAGRYHIRMLASPTATEVDAVMHAANVTAAHYRVADAPLVAAAIKHGVGVASANYDVLRLALRNNLAQNRIIYRSFNDPSQAVRIANYQRARRIVQNDPRGLNPWAITGSGVGR